jgi:hypothetical protein
LIKKSGRFDSLGLRSDGYLHLHHVVPGFTPVVLQVHRHAAEGVSGQPPRKLGEDSVWCRGSVWFGHQEPAFAESCPTHEVVLVVTGGQ